MKRRVLVTGKNHVIVDEFFYNMADTLECMTTSIRTEDVCAHIKFFQPEMLVYCLRDEGEAEGNKLSWFFDLLTEKEIPFVIIGDADNCNGFALGIGKEPALILTKPISASVIADKICKYLEALDSEKKAQEPAAPPAKKHVTVIDDDARMLKLIKEYLHEEYDVAVAVNGKVAMRFLENKHTDIILLDYVMPEEDGPEVYAKIRALPEYADIPIVFLTGISTKEKIQEVMMLRPQGYLLKPVEKERLMSKIRELIG